MLIAKYHCIFTQGAVACQTPGVFHDSSDIVYEGLRYGGKQKSVAVLIKDLEILTSQPQQLMNTIIFKLL